MLPGSSSWGYSIPGRAPSLNPTTVLSAHWSGSWKLLWKAAKLSRLLLRAHSTKLLRKLRYYVWSSRTWTGIFFLFFSKSHKSINFFIYSVFRHTCFYKALFPPSFAWGFLVHLFSLQLLPSLFIPTFRGLNYTWDFRWTDGGLHPGHLIGLPSEEVTEHR